MRNSHTYPVNYIFIAHFIKKYSIFIYYYYYILKYKINYFYVLSWGRGEYSIKLIPLSSLIMDVLDSWASFHVTSSKKLCKDYVSGNLGNTYLGDDQTCDMIGKGGVKNQMNGSI